MGTILTGMAFSQYGSRATWDHAGRQSANQATAPIILKLVLSENGATLTWPSVSGGVYKVSYKTFLTDASWVDASGEITASNTTTSWIDPSIPNTSQRFYRLLQVR